MPEIDLDWSGLTDTPLALEQARVDDGEPWCMCRVAGLQYYDYGTYDDVLGRKVIPNVGDRLNLMRRPDNEVDSRACEVWWRDGHHLGHLPRDLAADLADALDAGQPCRAYVYASGYGHTWQLAAVLVGEAVMPMHTRRLRATAAADLDAADEATFGVEVDHRAPYLDPSWRNGPLYLGRPSTPRLPGDAPTPRQAAAAAAWTAREDAARRDRQAAALAALGKLPRELPTDVDVDVSDEFRGKTFPWWDKVPRGLLTKTKLAEIGLRPAGNKPFARIAYVGYGRLRSYDLWAVREADAMRLAARRGHLASAARSSS